MYFFLYKAFLLAKEQMRKPQVGFYRPLFMAVFKVVLVVFKGGPILFKGLFRGSYPFSKGIC